MSNYSLSICIPTYNFGEFIAETLDSIVNQINDSVEIVVVDGASTDQTSAIVQHYVDTYPQVKYYRLETRGGIDKDMSASVDLASGKYCWMFSADDLMEPGAISRLLSEINFGYDIYICRHGNCTFDMHPISDHPVFNLSSDAEFSISSPEERKDYFLLAATTEAFFSFMGGIIIKRDKWISTPMNEKFVGSCWAHVARIFELVLEGVTLKYIHDLCLMKRGENDSFREDGVVQRYRLAIEGYNNIVNHYFGANSIEAYHVRRVLRNEFTIKQFLYAKLLCYKNPDIENKELLDSLVDKTCMDISIRNIIGNLAYRLTPIWGCKLGKYLFFIKSRLRRNGGSLDPDRLGL